ncbi:MAG TPA: NAD(P)/FAD-dependent oxidoreductase [Rhizomicrobium sp.]|jgi:phytoene dehydrogenase-like protein|nr:NAD(P)/FAD-dependent oxidoreductase [Rhizomicrobium sp.]
MAAPSDSEIAMIGGGHNALVCAFYLARAGHKVTIFERRSIVGGAAVTEEFYPGFRNSIASYSVSLLHPKVIADMDLPRRGLKIVERYASNFIPVDDHSYLLGTDPAEIAKFSAKDAEAIGPYTAELQTIADVVRELVLETPPQIGAPTWREALPELLKGARIGRQLSSLSLAAKRNLLALFAQSGGDWLDRWFESDPIKALLGFDAIVGNYASPFSPGSAYVLLHHVWGGVNGKQGTWGHAIGGMGAITQAMAAACAEHGVSIRLDDPVQEVLVRNSRAVGVATESGQEHRAKCVISGVNPKLLFTQLMKSSDLPRDFQIAMQNYRCASGTFRMNVALSELPRFTCLPEPGPHLNTGIVMAPSLAYMDRAYTDARGFGWSRQPIVEMLIPSVIDDTLAPAGRHVASLFCQHVAPELPQGSWDEYRDEVAELMLQTVDSFAPGFRKSVLGVQALSPLDLERTFGLIGGDIMHGRLDLDQMFSARPVLGFGNYRTPIRGLYMCGAGTHPGGGVSGIPGHNAAREILRDRRKFH